MPEIRSDSGRTPKAALDSTLPKSRRNRTEHPLRKVVTVAVAAGALALVGQPLVANAAEPRHLPVAQQISDKGARGEQKSERPAVKKQGNLNKKQGAKTPQRPTAPSPAQRAANAEAQKRDRILQAARAEIGTAESGDNCQKYSEQCVSWCALFATKMWQQAGVPVENDDYAFTGNVYTTGQAKGTAYGNDQLASAQPGDVLLFGTGPESPSTSKHIAIVEKVNGDTVTTIEGNTNGAGSNDGDGVYRKERPLSADTFYGGVRPW